MHGAPREHAVCWFHATRTLPNESFSSGVLHLGEAVDLIWQTLRDLLPFEAQQELPALRRKLESRRGTRYDDKVSNPAHWGPWAFLVRATAFETIEIPNHDYFASPEIVEDICEHYPDGDRLLEMFRRATRPCLVKLWSPEQSDAAVETALFYLYSDFHELGLSFTCNLCFDGKATRIPHDRILEVEHP